jgi:PIN domain nuclease of toxin-antitoxin system
MKRYLPDTSAFLALRDDEEGAGQVADNLRMAKLKKSAVLLAF